MILDLHQPFVTLAQMAVHIHNTKEHPLNLKWVALMTNICSTPVLVYDCLTRHDIE